MKECDSCKHKEKLLFEDLLCTNEKSEYNGEFVTKDFVCKCWEENKRMNEVEPRYLLDKDSICYGCQYFTRENEENECNPPEPCIEGSLNRYKSDVEYKLVESACLDDFTYECSGCGHLIFNVDDAEDYKYCPECGGKITSLEVFCCNDCKYSVSEDPENGDFRYCENEESENYGDCVENEECTHKCFESREDEDD